MNLNICIVFARLNIRLRRAIQGCMAPCEKNCTMREDPVSYCFVGLIVNLNICIKFARLNIRRRRAIQGCRAPCEKIQCHTAL